MIPFIRLTRPLNLLIIVITMYGLGWYCDEALIDNAPGIQSFDFFLLVISTVMIAAGGNIINDYFDVRADRINKPERLIIGKTVKRRVAIVTHWGLNFIAFSIASYLSLRLETFWYVFIHLLSINILWFYSSYFKRKFLIGNIMIAGLTALVPMLVGFYYYHFMEVHPEIAEPQLAAPLTSYPAYYSLIVLSISLAVFAFILNLAREIVKDLEDVKGDELLRARTVPIVLGNTSSKWLITAILLCSLAFGYILFDTVIPMNYKAFLPIVFSQALVLVALIALYFAKEKSQFKKVNTWIKLAMVAGLISPVYWKLLLLYA